MKTMEQSQAESSPPPLRDILTKEAIWTRLHIESTWSIETVWPPDYNPKRPEVGQCGPSADFYLEHLGSLAMYAQRQKERGARSDTMRLDRKFPEEELDAIFSDSDPDRHKHLQQIKQDYLAEQHGLFPFTAPDNEELLDVELFFSWGDTYNLHGDRLSNEYGHCWASIKKAPFEEFDVDLTFDQFDTSSITSPSPVVVQPSGDRGGQQVIYVPREQSPLEERRANRDERFAKIRWGSQGLVDRDGHDMPEEFFREKQLEKYLQFQRNYFPNLNIPPLDAHYRGPRLTVRPPYSPGRLDKVVEKVVRLLR